MILVIWLVCRRSRAARVREQIQAAFWAGGWSWFFRITTPLSMLSLMTSCLLRPSSSEASSTLSLRATGMRIGTLTVAGLLAASAVFSLLMRPSVCKTHTLAIKMYAKLLHVIFSGLMSSPNSVSFPVRMPSELKAQITALAEELGLSEQDVLRLCLRIGITDIESIKKDHAALVKEAADDCGASFSAWAKSKGAEKKEPPKKSNIIDLDEHIEKPGKKGLKGQGEP